MHGWLWDNKVHQTMLGWKQDSCKYPTVEIFAFCQPAGLSNGVADITFKDTFRMENV